METGNLGKIGQLHWIIWGTPRPERDPVFKKKCEQHLRDGTQSCLLFSTQKCTCTALIFHNKKKTKKKKDDDKEDEKDDNKEKDKDDEDNNDNNEEE